MAKVKQHKKWSSEVSFDDLLFWQNTQLREEFDRGGQITLSMETGVHDVATLLKEFFRDLPEPLIPKEVQPALLAIQSKLPFLQLFWPPEANSPQF